MGYAIIFAVLSGKPVVVEYRGPIQYFDRRYAHVISFEEAERKIERASGSNPPTYFWPSKGSVMHATKTVALDLLHDWMDGNPTKIPRRTREYRSKLGAIAD